MSGEHLVDSKKVLQTVKAFRALRQRELEAKNETLLLDRDQRDRQDVHLQLTIKKMSACQKIIMVPFTFPNTLIQPESEVCFIVGCPEDDKRNKRADHDRYANEWKFKLKQIGIDREIHVLPIMQLETEFKPHEAKRKLCKAFDHFICDHKVLFRVPTLLGTTFFRKRKIPVRVYTKDEDLLKKNIEEAINRTLLHITPEGPNISMKVGNLGDHTDKEIAENIRSILDEFIPKHLPGADSNVNTIHVASFAGKSVPMFYSMVSANDVDLTEVDQKFIEKQTPTEIEDSVETMPGVRVKVRSDGRVTAIKDDSEKLEVDDVLDEDYLDVFREQEFEERVEAKKRFTKHMARKGALRKVGKRFSANMLKLPTPTVLPKPAPVPKSPLPKQAAQNAPQPRTPKTPKVLDALKGFDEAPESSDEAELPKTPSRKRKAEDEVPELVPIETPKAKGKTPKKTETPVVPENFEVTPAKSAAKKAKRKSTTDFVEKVVEPTTPVVHKRKSDFKVESQKKEKAVSKVAKTPDMKVSKMMKTPGSVKKVSTPKAEVEDSSLTSILKTPRKSVGKGSGRKSVTFEPASQTKKDVTVTLSGKKKKVSLGKR